MTFVQLPEQRASSESGQAHSSGAAHFAELHGQDHRAASLFEVSCACANVRRAARAVTHLFDEVLAPSGMKISQFIILQVLHQQGPTSQSRLSEAMAVAEETLSRRLGLMRRAGWIELQPQRNRRKKIYRLTETGKKKYESALPCWIRAQRRLSTITGEERLREVNHCVELLTKAAQEALWAKLSNVV